MMDNNVYPTTNALSPDDIECCKLFFNDLQITKKNSRRGCTCQSCGEWLPWNDSNDNYSLLNHIKLFHPSYQVISDPNITIKLESSKYSRKDMSDNVTVTNDNDRTTISANIITHHYTQDSETTAEIITADLEPPSSSAVLKRDNVLIWDDYFMSVAFLTAMRSKDPSTQVGACIVNPDRKVIVGVGYNGFPRGCSDDVFPWTKMADNELDTKYMYVCHAEVNAILNKNSSDVEGCSIYVGLFPCNECAKMIIQSGIKEVVYLSDKYKETNAMIASRRMFTMAGVKLRQLTPSRNSVLINFSSIEGALMV